MNIDLLKPPEVITETENGASINILDGAVGVTEIERLKKWGSISSNKNFSVEERVEAYEDIFDSEVGDTSLVRARNLERELGIRQLFLKFEGGNPTGTQKDRIAFAQCMDALRRGFDTITVATCGNYGAAIALAAWVAGLRCVINIPEHYHTLRIKEMAQLGAEILRIPGNYENAVEYSQKMAEQKEMYDGNPGGNNTMLQLKAYGEIAYEIYDELRDAPKIVAAPMSNGTLIAGIYKGFLSLYRRGKTSRIPIMVGGSAYNKNPIIQAYIQNKNNCVDLIPDKIKETKINEPLINWHAFDGDYALDAIKSTNGWAGNASDKKMLEYAKMIRDKEGINVLPASTAGFVSLLEQLNKAPLTNDRFVVILTGRK
ncbi:MAG: pyridoxal-phosphate dependent enzyme [Bacteroidia bacterium]|nr:pyridoxal-phosphate dependent enzyme [Bacteroidia bacterium]